MTKLGVELLRHRVAELDGDEDPVVLLDVPDRDLVRFVDVMQHHTATGTPAGARPMAHTIRPDAADDLTQSCQLIQRLTARLPELVVGPLKVSDQQWIATGRPPHLPPRVAKPGEPGFMSPHHGSRARPSTKPVSMGLFTSTALGGQLSMWRIYLEINEGSSLFPKPWHVWHVAPTEPLRVLEVTTATDWVNFVLAWPARADGLVYPHWSKAASEWDAVHMSLRAVAATQALYLRSGNSTIAPPYWDVESTLWLNWRFHDATPIKTVA